MEHIWVNVPTIVKGKRISLPSIKGCNYFIVGNPVDQENGLSFSSRFDPASDLFQVWMGVYVAPPVIFESESFALSHLSLETMGNQDNIAWLAFMGYPAGTSRTRSLEYSKVPEWNTEDENCYAVSGSQFTRIDMGRVIQTSNPLWNYPAHLLKRHASPFQKCIQHTKGYFFNRSNYSFFIYYSGIELVGTQNPIQTFTPELVDKMEESILSFQLRISDNLKSESLESIEFR